MIRLKIKTHSGSEYEVEVSDYNASEINEKLNRNDVNTVAFGYVIISRIDVKSVVPLEDVEDMPTEEVSPSDDEHNQEAEVV